MSTWHGGVVWVTRDEARDGPLATALRAEGLTAVVEPVIRRTARREAATALEHASGSDLILFSSAYAVEVAGGPKRCARAAVVGPLTEEAAKRAGYEVVLSSRGGLSALIESIRKSKPQGTIWHPCSESAETLPPFPGSALIQVHLYDTEAIPFDRSVEQRVDAAAIASPSAARAIGMTELPCASIGPTTSNAMRRIGIEPCVEATEPTLEHLAASVADYIRSCRHQRA
jgi:uroporphyrinogen-III synthase